MRRRTTTAEKREGRTLTDAGPQHPEESGRRT